MAYIGLFGTVLFSCSSDFVQTFSSFSKKQGARFAEHAVIGQKPVLEYIAPEAATISMNIKLMTSLGLAPATGIKLFESMLEKGGENLLMIGTEYHGKFVLTGLDYDARFFSRHGAAQSADVKLDLKESSSGGIESLLSLFD